MTETERIEKALDTLAELCDKSGDDGVTRDEDYTRKSAAEEILRHYRERSMTDPERGVVINVRMQGHVPVRPVDRAEARGQ